MGLLVNGLEQSPEERILKSLTQSTRIREMCERNGLNTGGTRTWILSSKVLTEACAVDRLLKYEGMEMEPRNRVL